MEKLIAFFEQETTLETAKAAGLLLLVAIVATLLVKRVLLRVIEHLLAKTRVGGNSAINPKEVIRRLANIVPAVIISNGISAVPHLPAGFVTVVQNVANSFVVLTLAMAIAAALDVGEAIYSRRPSSKIKPITGYVQIVKIAIYVIATLLIIATLMDKSVLILLSGLGAMAAVLILVFQETLLSLVASIQIISTDMVRVGDWIEMPSANADGDVVDISLYTVQVQNWDKTISNIPIRKLVGESFRNWRGMSESGGRRIKRSIHLDQTSIRFLEPEEIENLRGFSQLAPYLDRKEQEIAEWNSSLGETGFGPHNARRLTNIGTFRAYIEAYLKSHPLIRQDMTLLVRQLPPARDGIPIEVYCFTNTTVWHEYEGIQSDIFDHLFARMSEFELRVFQDPIGRDFVDLAHGD